MVLPGDTEEDVTETQKSNATWKREEEEDGLGSIEGGRGNQERETWDGGRGEGYLLICS